ncbi:DDE-type integrase/transposase/recombinase [Neisseria yangbaofengii]|uniref:DDE-type integrase/transposase/recombinase n=1 Tax=Neisseria yangbaofengii TaxID=2709396 RepID=UPI0013EC4AB3|nr:DDE-type integrase/transposase/recombinase [Neisseria yangbaofengii]
MPNLLKRDFTAGKPNEIWLADITEIKAKDGNRLCISPIPDCFNSEIFSVTLSRHPNRKQVETTLRQSVEKLLENATPILHSDQGWQYQMRAYYLILQKNSILQSMVEKGKLFG